MGFGERDLGPAMRTASLAAELLPLDGEFAAALDAQDFHGLMVAQSPELRVVAADPLPLHCSPEEGSVSTKTRLTAFLWVGGPVQNADEAAIFLWSHFHDRSRQDGCQRRIHLRHEWNEIGEAIAIGKHDHEGNAVRCENLLEAKALVGRQ